MQVEMKVDAPLIERLVEHVRKTDFGKETAQDRTDRTAAATDQSARAVSPTALKEAVSAANRLVQQHTKELRFDVDADSGRTIVRVVDLATKDVLMQIPSEAMLALAKALEDPHASLLHSQV